MRLTAEQRAAIEREVDEAWRAAKRGRRRTRTDADRAREAARRAEAARQKRREHAARLAAGLAETRARVARMRMAATWEAA